MPRLLPSILLESSIKKITALSPGHPVFKLVWNSGQSGDQNLVIKHEGTAAEGLDVAYGLMREAGKVKSGDAKESSSGSNARVLAPGEVAAILRIARQAGSTIVDATAAAEIQRAAASVAPGKSTWLLMYFKEGLTELEKIIKDGDAQKAMLILLSLKEPENLERLGRILAVDLFTHNLDRFVVRPSDIDQYRQNQKINEDKVKRGKAPTALITAISNTGNVFFVDKGNGHFKIKGLDPYNTFQQMAQMDQTVSDITDDTDAGWWSGILLADDKQMRQVAQLACEGFNYELGNVIVGKGQFDKKVFEKSKLDAHDVKTVYHAMKEAREQIKGCCQLRAQGIGGRQTASAGLKSRMQLLGWS